MSIPRGSPSILALYGLNAARHLQATTWEDHHECSPWCKPAVISQGCNLTMSTTCSHMPDSSESPEEKTGDSCCPYQPHCILIVPWICLLASMSTVGCYFPGTRFRNLFTWLCSRSWSEVWSSSTSFSRPSLFQKSVSPFGYLVCQTCMGIDEQFGTVKYLLLLFFAKFLPNLSLFMTSQLSSLGSGKVRCPSVLRLLIELLTVPVIFAAVKVLFNFRQVNLSCSEYMYNIHTLQGSTQFSCGKQSTLLRLPSSTGDICWHLWHHQQWH